MSRFKNIILVICIILLTIVPLFMAKNGDFGGADDKAKGVIAEINSNYKPWFKPVWTPPSAEVASLLFCLQASIGAGFIGYFIGLAKGKREK